MERQEYHVLGVCAGSNGGDGTGAVFQVEKAYKWQNKIKHG